MNKERKILSDITVFSKYARYIPEKQRRETWEEVAERNKQMHLSKFPNLKETIDDVYELVKERKVVPSMRSAQFAGKAIEINPTRMYNCLSRDTTFVTKEGVKSFEDFEDGDEVTVLSQDGSWNKAKVRSYGEQDLYELTFKRGRSTQIVKATNNHRWILHDRSETTSLKVGDSLIGFTNIFSEFEYDDSDPMERLYWAYGYIYGDGTRVKDKDGTHKYSMVRLCGSDLKYKYRFEEIGFKTSTSSSLNGDFIAYTGSYLKTLPDPNVDDPNLIRAFVRGYLDADGAKIRDNTSPGLFKGIQTSSKNSMSFIEKVFPVAGVFVSSCRDLTGQKTPFAPDGRRETKNYNLFHHVSKTNMRQVLKSKTLIGKEEVWCLEVENTKNFVLGNGLVTGNCSFLPVDHPKAFSETMFLLLSGTGVGYSVQRKDIRHLPVVKKYLTQPTQRYLIQDSIIGWAEAIRVLMEGYFTGRRYRFDYRDIRPKGAELVTSGGKAPGPDPLKKCIESITALMDSVVEQGGTKLQPIEVHDIQCMIADAVLAGGIRRAAMISLFDHDDEEMLTCKSGQWWVETPYRARANNSAVLVRGIHGAREFNRVFDALQASNAGEPGFYWTSDQDMGTNPCVEIALNPFQMCNLTEINAATVESQEDLEERAWAATVLGTLQASYTDFHYLRPIWQETTEREALLGVSLTGVASLDLDQFDWEKVNNLIKNTNKELAGLIGINESARITCIKPSGTSSLVLGTPSGVHAAFSNYYIRRMRLNKNESLYTHMAIHHPELIEDEQFDPLNTAVLSVPQMFNGTTITRADETAVDFLNRVKKLNQLWVHPGHNYGANTHNISATVNVKEDEWDQVRSWMWENREFYNGLSILPYDGGSYVQAPFEEITKEKFHDLCENLRDGFNPESVVEMYDLTDINGTVACGPGGCEVVSV